VSAKILRCRQCNTYTMVDKCELCGSAAVTPHPPRFSPEDRYGKYRRQLKALVNEGK
jgi:H/ACA ribonucleoprotein complex subunit 3